MPDNMVMWSYTGNGERQYLVDLSEVDKESRLIRDDITPLMLV
jgi:hypothetical protein